MEEKDPGKKDKKGKENFETIDLTELAEGRSLFESKGFSLVKVTHEGKTKALKIPIKSSGISELIDTFQNQAPTAPGRKAKVEKGSDMASDLGISKTQWVWISDYSDPDYIEAKQKYDSDLGIEIVLHGIDLPIKDREGNVVTERSKKISILRGMGISSEQFSQIVKDISSLTKWEDEKEDDFL